jgi:hypothetical protein
MYRVAVWRRSSPGDDQIHGRGRLPGRKFIQPPPDLVSLELEDGRVGDRVTGQKLIRRPPDPVVSSIGTAAVYNGSPDRSLSQPTTMEGKG